jgi:hypothetical protein
MDKSHAEGNGPAGASFANGNGPDSGRPAGQQHWWTLV